MWWLAVMLAFSTQVHKTMSGVYEKAIDVVKAATVHDLDAANRYSNLWLDYAILQMGLIIHTVSESCSVGNLNIALLNIDLVKVSREWMNSLLGYPA